MDTTGLAHPKPSHAERRTKESPYQYRKRKAEMWREQEMACALCFRPLDSPESGHRHHLDGRGLGGGNRDDSKTQLLCIRCHTEHHA